MTTYTEARESLDTPHVIPLEPAAWQDDWTHRPVETVAVGIRAIGVKDYQQAFNEAAKWCAENAPTENPQVFLENVKIRLQIWCVARAVCDPNNIHQAYFERGDEEVEEALRPEGVRYLYDAFETLHLEESVVAPLANDDEVLDLVSILAANKQLPALPDAKQARCRRLIRHLLDTLAQ